MVVFEIGAGRAAPPKSCCVCNGDAPEKDNAMVVCEGSKCGLIVHQRCYGVTTLPSSGKWYCKKCEPFSTIRSSKVRCCLCPARTGALKPTARSPNRDEFAHIVCALALPHTSVQNWATTMDLIKVDTRPESMGTCALCSRKDLATSGATIRCCGGGKNKGEGGESVCDQWFHVTCAQEKGLLSWQWSAGDGSGGGSRGGDGDGDGDPQNLSITVICAAHRKAIKQAEHAKVAQKRPVGKHAQQNKKAVAKTAAEAVAKGKGAAQTRTNANSKAKDSRIRSKVEAKSNAPTVTTATTLANTPAPAGLAQMAQEEHAEVVADAYAAGPGATTVTQSSPPPAKLLSLPSATSKKPSSRPRKRPAGASSPVLESAAATKNKRLAPTTAATNLVDAATANREGSSIYSSRKSKSNAQDKKELSDFSAVVDGFLEKQRRALLQLLLGHPSGQRGPSATTAYLKRDKLLALVAQQTKEEARLRVARDRLRAWRDSLLLLPDTASISAQAESEAVTAAAAAAAMAKAAPSAGSNTTTAATDTSVPTDFDSRLTAMREGLYMMADMTSDRSGELAALVPGLEEAVLRLQCTIDGCFETDETAVR